MLPGVLGAHELEALNGLIDDHIQLGDFDEGSNPLSMRFVPPHLGATEGNGLADWGAPFRDLIAHPRVTPILVELLSEPRWASVHPRATDSERRRIRLDHDYLDVHRGSEEGTLNSQGTSGLHGDAFQAMHVTAVWELRDIPPGQGGFVSAHTGPFSPYPLPAAALDPWCRGACLAPTAATIGRSGAASRIRRAGGSGRQPTRKAFGR